MLRSSFYGTLTLLVVTGCSLLHPVTRPHAKSTIKKTTPPEVVAAAVGESVDSVKSDEEDGASKLSIGDKALLLVVVPVYSTSYFVWWIANGCPDP